MENKIEKSLRSIIMMCVAVMAVGSIMLIACKDSTDAGSTAPAASADVQKEQAAQGTPAPTPAPSADTGSAVGTKSSEPVGTSTPAPTSSPSSGGSVAPVGGGSTTAVPGTPTAGAVKASDTPNSTSPTPAVTTGNDTKK